MKLRPVLVRPRYAGNLGGVIRVAANFGIDRLVVVRPECDLDSPELLQMAMGGERRVQIQVVDSLDEAIRGADVVVATTSGRQRDPRQIHTPEAVREKLKVAGAETVAIVFGSERSGLNHAELGQSHLMLTIPANPAFPTLNLVQAVAIVLSRLLEGAYEPVLPADPQDGPAPAEELDAALAHLQRALFSSSFLDPVNPARVMDQLRRFIGRTIPTRRELALLHGLAAHFEYLHGRGKPGA
ncbi:MAG: TrmH family RNA methyltransferase [Acidobacteriota bacterium]